MKKRMKVKSMIKALPALALIMAALSGCGSTQDAQAQEPADDSEQYVVRDSEPGEDDAPVSTSGSSKIFVVSREDGSGTRGAFIELTGVEEKDENGDKFDNTTEEASIKNSTSAVLTTVAGNESAVGYISLGSMSSEVKAVKVDGIEATADHVKDGSYVIARPFNIATTADVTAETQDFIDFMMSAEGQAVIAENNYIPVDDNAPAFTGGDVSGKIVIAGSSSISPVMEKLIEAYGALNSGVEIELQTSDSTTGMTAAVDGICDIGMASRALKDSELEKGLSPVVIAMDGIAVIVHNDNGIEELTLDQIKAIFTGEVSTWEELSNEITF